MALCVGLNKLKTNTQTANSKQHQHQQRAEQHRRTQVDDSHKYPAVLVSAPSENDTTLN